MSSRFSDVYLEDEAGNEIPLHDDDSAEEDPAAVERTNEDDPHDPRGGDQESFQRRRLLGGIIASVFCVCVIAAALIPAMVLVVNDSTDEENLDVLPSRIEEASVTLRMRPVEAEMDPLQQVTFLTACDEFFANELPRFENVRTQFELQQLLSEEERRHRRRLQDSFTLEVGVTVQVEIPFVARLTNLNATDLQRAVFRNGAVFLDILQATDDPYMKQINQVEARIVTIREPEPVQPIERDPNACNGLLNLCDMPVNEILFATMHNANSDSQAAPLAPNHRFGIIAGLRAGIRGLNIDIGRCANDQGEAPLALVHGSCALGSTDPVSVLTRVQQFLTDNPREVILMPVQINDATGGRVRLRQLDVLFEQVVDDQGKTMKERLYAHPRWNDTSIQPERYPWPTLREMIAIDKRIIFMFYNGEQTCLDNPSCPTGFHDYFLYAAETDFGFDSVQEIIANPQAACNITRGNLGFRDFFGINVFLNIPSADASQVLNSEAFLENHFATCEQVTMLAPNMILVDFWNTGDLIAFTESYNAALIPRTRVPPAVTPTVSPVTTIAPMQESPPVEAVGTFSPTKAPNPVIPPTSAPVAPFTPTGAPTASPTATPVMPPIPIPVSAPTASPPATPTSTPTASPEAAPTSAPVMAVAPQGTLSSEPTRDPSASPVNLPTNAPFSQEGFSPTITPGTRRCNGLENICNLPVNDILFATLHNGNSHAGVVDFFANHDGNILQALTKGFRGLNVDIGKCVVGGVPRLSLVHTTCLLGFSDPLDVFKDINQFLLDNPNEVILMPCQIDDNVEGKVTLNEIKVAMEQVTDTQGRSFANRLYAHPGPSTPWPTVGELVDADTRVLFFVYNGEETCNGLGDDCPIGIHDWFQYAAETEFSFPNLEAIQNNPTNACTITRGGRGTRDFFGINVFTQLPRREWSAVLNSASFLAGHIETCSAQNSLDPNVILVDFYGQGDVVDVVQAHNEGLAGPSPDPQAAMDTEQPSLQPTSQPTPSFLDPARKELYDLICLRLGSKEDCDNLLDTETARGQAFEWLFSNDALEFLTNEKKVQRYALATHYYSANGAAWTSNSGWLSNIDECLWATSAFLSCDGDGQYISLVLDSNNMEGSVPYEIGMLTTLTSVDLSNNALSGEIPTSLGRLTMLTSLDLSNNDFTGPIPTTLGLLSNLEVLTLRANSLTAIPTELGQLFSLQQMYVGENQLVGTISTELGNLQRLTALGLDKNKLTGTLPAEVSKLTLLQVMDLSSNNLSGLVSTGLRNFRDLSFLSLHNNLFIGPLPAELGELTGLRLLDLSVNNLFGTLPESLRQLELMDELLLNSNNLVGEVRVLTSLQRLKRLRIDDNDFSGVAPQELCDLFDQIQPVVFADCQEITVPCATYCCEDGNGCVCRFESTDPLRCLMM